MVFWNCLILAEVLCMILIPYHFRDSSMGATPVFYCFIYISGRKALYQRSSIKEEGNERTRARKHRADPCPREQGASRMY